MYDVVVRCGTNGYEDEYGVDLLLCEVKSKKIPCVGEKLSINLDNYLNVLLVTDVERFINHDDKEEITVYVLNLGYYKLDSEIAVLKQKVESVSKAYAMTQLHELGMST